MVRVTLLLASWYKIKKRIVPLKIDSATHSTPGPARKLKASFELRVDFYSLIFLYCFNLLQLSACALLLVSMSRKDVSLHHSSYFFFPSQMCIVSVGRRDVLLHMPKTRSLRASLTRYKTRKQMSSCIRRRDYHNYQRSTRSKILCADQCSENWQAQEYYAFLILTNISPQ